MQQFKDTKRIYKKEQREIDYNSLIKEITIGKTRKQELGNLKNKNEKKNTFMDTLTNKGNCTQDDLDMVKKGKP